LYQALQAAAAAGSKAAATQQPTAQPALTSIGTPGELADCQEAQLPLQQQHPQHLQQQQQQQHDWRLASFSCNLSGAAGMLAALPAHSLTSLDLGITNSYDTSSKELAAALARLSSLQRLCIASDSVFTDRTWPPQFEVEEFQSSCHNGS
jgi:hypothetical protein